MVDEVEQNEKDKAMIDSMRLAQKNMTAALDRIEKLECALKLAASSIQRLKGFLPDHAYTYGGKDEIRDLADRYAADALKLL